MSNLIYHSLSKEIQEQILEDREKNKKNPFAFKDENVIRRYAGHDTPHLWRPTFVMDVDKILHNNYYNRYSDKTQVLSCYKNDDISRRALHVQFVSRIARTIGMALGLNLDLIEAISLGHDIGHTPFGHAGERFLNDNYNAHTGRLFNHNVHSVRVLDKLIVRNVSLQVLDGVICHNGEMEQQNYKPKVLSSFEEFDKNVEDCYTDPDANKRQIPCTLEGCIMRISDIIAYLGKDRQDVEKISGVSTPLSYTSSSIGTTNSEIINNLTVSIIENSYGKDHISMSEEAFSALVAAKKENYELIYGSKVLKEEVESNIEPMFAELYEELLKQANNLSKDSILYKHHILFLEAANRVRYDKETSFLEKYLANDPNEIVTDFIASMTDDYFIDLHNLLFPKSSHHLTYKGYFD